MYVIPFAYYHMIYLRFSNLYLFSTTHNAYLGFSLLLWLFMSTDVAGAIQASAITVAEDTNAMYSL